MWQMRGGEHGSMVVTANRYSVQRCACCSLEGSGQYLDGLEANAIGLHAVLCFAKVMEDRPGATAAVPLCHTSLVVCPRRASVSLQYIAVPRNHNIATWHRTALHRPCRLGYSSFLLPSFVPLLLIAFFTLSPFPSPSLHSSFFAPPFFTPPHLFLALPHHPPHILTPNP